MKIKIPQAGRKQVGIAVKVALAVAAAYAIVSGAIYVWPRVKCAVVNPALQAGENSLRMKGCWVAEDSSVQRGYTTYTFTEWPVAEDSRRIRMTLDTETDGSKLGDYAKPVTFPWGKALEITRATASAGNSKGTLLFLPEHGAWLSAPDTEYVTQIESLGR